MEKSKVYTTNLTKTKAQTSNMLTVVDKTYVETLLQLHKKLARRGIDWALSGDLGEALKTVQVTPDCFEIVTNRRGAAQIFLTVQDCSPTGVYFQTHKLSRNALVDGKEYPVFVRSYYFEFTINGVKVKVYGDMQLRISDWEWGNRIEFTPEHVYVVGEKTAVVPLSIKYEIYQQLGWADRAEKILSVLLKHTAVPAR
jgi:hypothetical protein